VDVVNPDPRDTKDRYDEFMSFNYYRFAAGTTEDYLKTVMDMKPNNGLRDIESAHERFMRSHHQSA